MTTDEARYSEQTLIAHKGELLESSIKVSRHTEGDGLRLVIETDDYGDPTEGGAGWQQQEVWLTRAEALKLAEMLREMATV